MREPTQNKLGVFLGAGGEEPRVDNIDFDTLERKTLARFPIGHSAYALDFDWKNRRFSVGTKGGLIHIFDDFSDHQVLECRPSRSFLQGAPVLSVSHVGKSKLAASDTAGRCFLWEIRGEQKPLQLETGGSVVFSLLALSENSLAGLSSKGTFLRWNLSESELSHERPVSLPPPMGGFVRLVSWDAAKALAFPNIKGELVIYDPEKDVARKIKAHDGAFYALCVFGESLLTLGLSDGVLRLWAADSRRPLCEFSGPTGILSVSSLGFSNQRLLLVTSEGKAQTYLLDKKGLYFDKRLEGLHYRVSFSPPFQIMEAHENARKDSEAHELWTHLANVNQSDPGAAESYLSRLSAIGYEHVALAFRADQMEKAGNLAESIKLRADLSQMLPESPRACPSIEKYAAMLDRAFLFAEAETMCKRILRIDPSYRFQIDFNRISKNAELMKTNRYTIEPDIAIKNLVHAANALGRVFSGCYLQKKLRSLHCSRIILNPQAIAKTYLEVQKRSKQPLPAIEVEKGWWISGTESLEMEFVGFVKAPSDGIKGLRFVLQILPHAHGTIVVPVILFDWDNHESARSPEESNRDALKALANLSNGTSSSYVREIHRLSTHVLRRLITKEAKGQRDTQ
jgi:hypothetical protein